MSHRGIGRGEGAFPVWDPALYDRFKAERTRPFLDLIARMPDGAVRTVADLGCGTGETTRLLLDRWRGAQVWGLDRSVEMLERARSAEPRPGLTFLEADVRNWAPPQPLDRIVSNSVFHWIPDHGALLRGLASRLAPGGALGVQIPSNRDERAYRLVTEIVSKAGWADRIARHELEPTLETPSWYLERLGKLGFDADLWETIYHHRLSGPEDVLRWLEGTTLRPILSALSSDESSRFLASLSAGIAEAYRPGPAGVLFPFRRLFFVATLR